MSNKEYAMTLVNSLTNEQIDALIQFLSTMMDEDIIARIECDLLAKNPDAKIYNNFDEFMLEMEKNSDD